MFWLSYQSFSILSDVFCQKKVLFPVKTALNYIYETCIYLLIWFLKLILQVNSSISENKIKQKQKNNQNKDWASNSILKLSFLCCIKDIKITWINTCKIYIQSSDVSKTRHLFINQRLIKAYAHYLFFHQMIGLQKLWKMYFSSSKKLFWFSRYSYFCSFSFPISSW